MYKIIKVIIILGKDHSKLTIHIVYYKTDCSYLLYVHSYWLVMGFVFFYNFDAVLIVLSSDNLKADRTVIKLIENNTSPSPR
jgi:hypothetical protein